jgi:hypothetical protein
MVAQDRVSQAINGKNTGEELQSLPNPFTSMLKRLTGQWIIATQERPSYTALNAVNDLDFRWIKHLSTSKPRHRNLPIKDV